MYSRSYFSSSCHFRLFRIIFVEVLNITGIKFGTKCTFDEYKGDSDYYETGEMSSDVTDANGGKEPGGTNETDGTDETRVWDIGQMKSMTEIRYSRSQESKNFENVWWCNHMNYLEK